jgi:hypothetical protein
MERVVLRGALIAAIALAVTPAASEEAAAAPNERMVERPVQSGAPDADRVKESFVRVHAPLPESVGPHPARCDWIGYLRFRHRGGPREPKRADAVLVAIPGFLGGASSFDQVARNVVLNAAASGKDAEFWALDRRANCVEDHRGVRGAARARDPKIAFDYYWGNREVNGRGFSGFKDSDDAAFLSELGLEQTMRDWYRVIQRIPGRKRRARKLLCGGHSLGGPLTAAFASWDFDNDPSTRRDAGYRQCAGLFGLDTTVSLDGDSGGPSGAGFLLDLVARSGAAPFINAPPFTPETIQLPSVFGVGAYHQPRGIQMNKQLPRTTNINLAQRTLFSRNAIHFATGDPDIREFEVTNQATLAGVFDDNSSPISILRSSVGMIRGGPLVDKNFPAPDPTLALPEDPEGPLYRWQAYRRVGARGAPIPPNDSGDPYTSRQSEVSDLRQLARAMFEAPANFVEQYFPTRIVTEVAAAEGGDRSGDLEHLRYDGPSKRPIVLIQAGDSDSNSDRDRGPNQEGTPPNGFRLSREVVLPGYNHLDVTTAARRQNDGRPEGSAKTLTRFALKLTRQRP